MKLQSDVGQKWRRYFYKILFSFSTIPKCSSLLLIDRHHNACLSHETENQIIITTFLNKTLKIIVPENVIKYWELSYRKLLNTRVFRRKWWRVGAAKTWTIQTDLSLRQSAFRGTLEEILCSESCGIIILADAITWTALWSYHLFIFQFLDLSDSSLLCVICLLKIKPGEAPMIGPMNRT